MKKNLLAVFFILFCHFLNAQQQIDSRIQEVYGDQTEELVANRPERLKYLNEILQKRFRIEESAISPDDKFPKLSQVELLNKHNPNLKRDEVVDINTFNPLKYNFSFLSQNTEVYRIDNTNYIIVIEPKSINH